MNMGNGQSLFSAIVLANYRDGTHATALERQVVVGRLTRKCRHNAMRESLIEIAESHGDACLNSLRAEEQYKLAAGGDVPPFVHSGPVRSLHPRQDGYT